MEPLSRILFGAALCATLAPATGAMELNVVGETARHVRPGRRR